MKEEQTIEYLYEGLENEILRGRVEAILRINIRQRRLYKHLYYIFSTISIGTPIFVNILQVMDGSILGQQNLKLITMIFTTITILASTFIAMFSFKEQWKSRVNLVDALMAQLVSFQIGVGQPEEIDYEELGRRIESIIGQFNKEKMAFIDAQNVNIKSKKDTK